VNASSAGIARRLAALLYDALLLVGLLMVFTFAVLPFTHGSAVLPDTAGAWVYLYRAGLVAVVAAYFVGNWLHSGQTLGMRAWHLYVQDADGSRLRLLPALLRFLLAVAAWLPAGIGVLWLYLDPARLTLHDRLAKTRMIHSASPRNRGGRAGADHEGR
jgi:uncharacterized RDD family membrane protein YckC